MLLIRDRTELEKRKRECQGLPWGYKPDRLARKCMLGVVECSPWNSMELLREKREKGQKRHKGWLCLDLTFQSPKPHAYKMCSTQHPRLDQT